MFVVVLIILLIISVLLLIRNFFLLVFQLEHYGIHRKRFKQLRFEKKDNEIDPSMIIDKATQPIIKYLFSYIKPKRLDELAIDLKMAKWDKYLTPLQFRAIDLLLKTIAVILLIFFFGKSKLFAFTLFFIFFFSLNFLLKNSVSNRKHALLKDFPDFIRITEGYLSADIPFSKAVSEAIKYVGDEWKPILQQFVIETELKSLEEALNMLKREVDLFEVREFVALVTLTLEQGGDIKESFFAQAKRIRDMQLSLMEMEIDRRKILITVLQGPLLLCSIVALGLPTIGELMNFGLM